MTARAPCGANKDIRVCDEDITKWKEVLYIG